MGKTDDQCFFCLYRLLQTHKLHNLEEDLVIIRVESWQFIWNVHVFPYSFVRFLQGLQLPPTVQKHLIG